MKRARSKEQNEPKRVAERELSKTEMNASSGGWWDQYTGGGGWYQLPGGWLDCGDTNWGSGGYLM